ncbi:hypothetical protein D3C80_1952330 [compost metagenome]
MIVSADHHINAQLIEHFRQLCTVEQNIRIISMTRYGVRRFMQQHNIPLLI